MENTLQQQTNIIMPRGGVEGEKGVQKFINTLVGAHVISKDQRDDYMQYNSAEDIFDYLLTQSSIDEAQLVKAYAYYMGARFADLHKIDNDVLSAVPYRLASKYYIVPFALSRKVLKVAIAYPTRLARGELTVLNEIGQRSRVKVEVSFATRSAVLAALKKLSGAAQSQDNMPEANLINVSIPPETIKMLPRAAAEKYKVIVFEEVAPNSIKLGAVDPGDAKVQEFINQVAHDNNIAIEQYKITPEGFQAALRQYDGTEESKEGHLPFAQEQTQSVVAPQPEKETTQQQATVPDKEARTNILASAHVSSDTNLDKSLPQKVSSAKDIQQFVASGNVPQILAAIMKLASEQGASDIHVEAQKDNVVVRFRIDGVMKTVLAMPNALQKAIVARVKILAKLKIDETRIPQDGRFDLVVNGHDIDVRVSIMPTIFGEKIVLRLLDKNAGLFKIESLGITGENYKRFITAIEKPYGVVMVTGPTGAGKSTTLYAAINHLHKDTQNIVTLEDPVEYEIPGINQIQVKPNIGFTFAEGLSAVLRQDPNVIMVGEIRDSNTANLVTHASLTGHLVLTTLHTNDASGAMPRLTNMGVEPFLIASAMNAIVGQRLVRKICTKCRVEFNPPTQVKQEVEDELKKLGIQMPMRFFRGQGCSVCSNTGYSGRTGIYEVLDVDEGMEQLIIARAPSNKIEDYAVAHKMYPMRIDGFVKVSQGITTIDEVMRATAIN